MHETNKFIENALQSLLSVLAPRNTKLRIKCQPTFRSSESCPDLSNLCAYKAHKPKKCYEIKCICVIPICPFLMNNGFQTDASIMTSCHVGRPAENWNSHLGENYLASEQSLNFINFILSKFSLAKWHICSEVAYKSARTRV